MKWEVIEASTAEEYKAAVGLFNEYIASLDFDLDFQNVDHELTILPTMYGPPTGRLFHGKIHGMCPKLGLYHHEAGYDWLQDALGGEVVRVLRISRNHPLQPQSARRGTVL